MKRPKRLRGWRLVLFAKCGDATRAMSDALDGPVALDRRWAAGLHTLVCGPCRCQRRWFRWLGGLAPGCEGGECEGDEPSICLSESSKGRLREALRTEAQPRAGDFENPSDSL